MPHPPKLTCVSSFQIEEPQKKSGAGTSTVVARVRSPRSWLWQEGCYDVYPPFFSTGSKPLARVRLCCTSPTKTRVTSTYTKKKRTTCVCLSVERFFFLSVTVPRTFMLVLQLLLQLDHSFPQQCALVHSVNYNTFVRAVTLCRARHFSVPIFVPFTLVL